MQLAKRHDGSTLLVTALGSLSTQSRASYISCLNRIAQLSGYPDASSCPWERIEPEHVAAIRLCLKSEYSPSTINVHLSAFACVVKACWRESLITSDKRDKLLDFKREPGSRELAGRSLSNSELSALFSACRNSQEKAILSVLYSCGLRRSEVVSLKKCDLTGQELRVIGKGNKERKVFLSSRVLEYVHKWLDERGEANGPLFCKADGSAFSDKSVYRLCKRLKEVSGVADFTPHDLRRSMVSNLLDAGVDLPTVQGIAGHASPQMTARYDRRKDVVRQNASELLFVP